MPRPRPRPPHDGLVMLVKTPFQGQVVLQPPDQPGGLTVVGKEQQGRVHRRDLLGGLLHEYRYAA
jgi:hypothetical protein